MIAVTAPAASPAYQAARWFRQYHRDRAKQVLTDTRFPKDERDLAAMGEYKAASVFADYINR